MNHETEVLKLKQKIEQCESLMKKLQPQVDSYERVKDTLGETLRELNKLGYAYVSSNDWAKRS